MGLTRKILLLALALAPLPALACREGPGPGKGDPAPLGQKGGNRTAKFTHGREQAQVQIDLLDRPLAKIAELCGDNQLTVGSGYRSPAYNASIGGKKGSQHKCGNAADMSFCKGKSLGDMFKILARAGCGGIGCYPTFVQCDIGPKRQWGPCPGQRPPPDDPQDEKRLAENNKEKPPTSYDSTTPPEPLSPAAQNPPPPQQPEQAPAGSPPPSQSASSPPASYPQPLAQASPRGIGFGDQRGTALAPRKPRAPSERQPPGESVKIGKDGPSTITRPGELVAPGETRVPPGSASNGAFTMPVTNFGAIASGPASPFGKPAGAAVGGPSRASSGSATLGETTPPPSRGARGSASVSGSPGGSGSAADAVGSYGTTRSLGAGAVSMGGSTHDFDASIRNIQEKEFGEALRAPASASEPVTDESSLFHRCHEAHLRCLRGGCVTAGTSGGFTR